MQRHEFLLIENDDAAMKLALAWPQLPHDEYEGEEPEELFSQWAETAGVADLDAYRCAPVLFANAICLPDGSLDPTAQAMIAAKLAVRLRAARAAASRSRGGRA